MDSHRTRWRRLQTSALVIAFLALCLALAAQSTSAQTSSPALLVLEKGDNSLAIVDPATLKIVAHVPAGADPHEIVVSADGKTAYISNYGGLDSSLNTISVVDLTARKALQPISLGALHSAHGLDFSGGKLYFTVETNKALGRYDPATQSVDWVLGTGQDRTHMVIASPSLDRIFTSNVNSGTISIIEQVASPFPGPPQAVPRKTWELTNVPSGRGSEGFDVSPDGKQVWAANAQDGTVTIIDVAAKKPLQTFAISVEHANRLKFTPDGKRVLVSGLGAFPPSAAGGVKPGAPNLAVLDAATHKLVKGLDLGGGSAGILILADGSRAFVAVSGKDKVVAIDLSKLEVTGEISTGKGPDGLAWAQPQ